MNNGTHDSIGRTIARVGIGTAGTITLGGLIAYAIAGASPGVFALTAANVATLLGGMLPNMLSDGTKACVKKVMAFLFERGVDVTAASIAHGIDEELARDPSLSKAVLHDVRQLLADEAQLTALLGQIEADLQQLQADSSQLLSEVQNTHLSTVSAYEYLKQQIASLGESQNQNAQFILDKLHRIEKHFTAQRGSDEVLSAAERREAENAFLSHVIENSATIRFRGVQQVKLAATLPIASVYVNLTARSTSIGMNSRLSEREWAATIAAPAATNPVRAEEWRRQNARASDGPALKVNRVVAEQDKLVLLGEPGAGKTTTLSYVSYCNARALLDGAPDSEFGPVRLPIYIRIGAYAVALGKDDLSLSEYLSRFYNSYNFTDPRLPALLLAALREGRAIVMLDGLDEISQPSRRNYIMRQIETLAHNYPHNRFIVTSRVAGYAAVAFGPDWKQFTIQPMQRDEVARFITSWCREVEAQNVQPIMQEAENTISGIMHAIDTNPGVARLATNPLLLVVLAFTYRNETKLPERRIELYHTAARILAYHWRMAQLAAQFEGQQADKSKQAELIPEVQVGEVLNQLAYCLRAYRSDGLISEPELRHYLHTKLPEVLGDELPDPSHPSYESKLTAKANWFIERIRTDTGLLVERGYNQDDQALYGFMHPTFEEYYAARYLINRYSGDRHALIKLLCHHLPDPRWEEVLLLLVGYFLFINGDLSSATDILSQLCFTPNPRPPQEDILHRGLVFGWRAAGDGLKLPSGGASRLIKDTLEIYCDNDTVKGKGRYELLQEQLETVIALTDTPGNSVNARLTETLLQRLSEDGQLVYRYPRLFRVSEPLRRAATARLLADWRERDNDNLRLAAAAALGQLAIADPEVVKALLASVQREESDWVRRTAIEALGHIGISHDEVLATLTSCLKDEHHTVSRSAAAALGRLGTNREDVASALLSSLECSADHSLCSAVIAALGQAGVATEEVIEALLVSLRQSDDDLERSSAATALGQLRANSERVVTALLERFRLDDDRAVRSAIAAALGQLGNADVAVVEALLSSLRDGDDDAVRSAAALALGQLGVSSREVVASLIERLEQQGEDASVRSWSATALWRLGVADNQGLSTLRTSLRDRDDEVRLAAAEALAALGDNHEDVMQELRYAAQHPTSFLRYDRAYRSLYEAVSKQRSEPDTASCSWLDNTLLHTTGLCWAGRLAVELYPFAENPARSQPDKE